MPRGPASTLRRGEVLHDAAELERLISLARVDPRSAPGRVHLIIDPSPVRALCRALAVRRAGGIVLVGDPRWGPQFRAALAQRIAAAPPLPTDLAWATSTSGSTGTPRVVLRDARSWSSSFAAIDALLAVGDRDQILAASPLISSIALFAAIYALEGSHPLILPAGAQLEAGDLHPATILHGTPQALRRALELIENGARSSLRAAMIGGSRLDSHLRTRAEGLGITVVSYYGAAELSFVAADSDGTGLRPFPDVALQIRADPARPEGASPAAGELWVSSPYLARGYLEGEAGGGALRREGHEHPWMSVGDLATLEPNGALRLHGRGDGAILTASATVIPEDVEAALRSLPGIADAIVFAVAAPRIGALLAAVIEWEDGTPAPTRAALNAAARELLTSSHRPRRWYLTRSLPRTLAGKVDRGAVAARAAAATTTIPAESGAFRSVL